jgi:hypothetical protein
MDLKVGQRVRLPATDIDPEETGTVEEVEGEHGMLVVRLDGRPGRGDDGLREVSPEDVIPMVDLSCQACRRSLGGICREHFEELGEEG